MKTIPKEDLKSFVEKIDKDFEMRIPPCWDKHPSMIQWMTSFYLARTTLEMISDGNGMIHWLTNIYAFRSRISEFTPGCTTVKHIAGENEDAANDQVGYYDCALIESRKKATIANQFEDEGDEMDRIDILNEPGELISVEEFEATFGKITEDDLMPIPGVEEGEFDEFVYQTEKDKLS